MQSAPTTNMLIAKRSLQKELGSEAVEWAAEQLVQGRDTPHLRQLAGMAGNENRFELEELFDRTLRELSLSVPNRDQALLIYARELARDYLNGGVARERLLQELCELCIHNDYMKELYPFYLLRWTHDDLKEQAFSFYRQDATRENFEQLLGGELENLLKT